MFGFSFCSTSSLFINTATPSADCRPSSGPPSLSSSSSSIFSSSSSFTTSTAEASNRKPNPPAPGLFLFAAVVRLVVMQLIELEFSGNFRIFKYGISAMIKKETHTRRRHGLFCFVLFSSVFCFSIRIPVDVDVHVAAFDGGQHQSVIVLIQLLFVTVNNYYYIEKGREKEFFLIIEMERYCSFFSSLCAV